VALPPWILPALTRKSIGAGAAAPRRTTCAQPHAAHQERAQSEDEALSVDTEPDSASRRVGRS
jgi:hypothetical protein